MCRYTRIVVLAGVNIINKHSKGRKSQCRYSRIVVIAGVVLAGLRIFNKSKGFHNGIWLHGHFKVTTGTIGFKLSG